MRQKYVAITGASRGIGRALALEYARHGWHTAICCRHHSSELEETAEELALYGIRCLPFVGDMGDENDVERFFDCIRQDFGTLHVLINNAGISHVGLLQDMTAAEWNQVIASNLNSVFYCSRQAIRMMLPKKAGKILSISSVWGDMGASMEVAYSASKGGVNAFTKALAKELAPSNIQVNAIACGAIDTSMNAFLSETERCQLAEEIPAGRFGTAEEVARLAWQINEKNDYLTGQVITLNGGWT